MYVFDAHSDIMSDLTTHRLEGKTGVFASRHLPDLRKGGIKAYISAIWIEPPFNSESPNKRMMDIIEHGFAEYHACGEVVFPVRSHAELKAAVEGGKIAVIMGMEGLEGLEQNPERLYFLHELGLRHVSLTWNPDNAFAGGVRGSNSYGVTELGRRALKIIEELHIMLDVSHASEKTFWDIVENTTCPIIASHSNAYSLCANGRNLKDEQIKAIAQRGGLIGLNAWPEFIDEKTPSAEGLADHADYIKKLVGVEHVMLGFDFCDYLSGDALSSFQQQDQPVAEGITTTAEAMSFVDVLKKRGYSAKELEMIAHKNAEDFFKKIVG